VSAIPERVRALRALRYASVALVVGYFGLEAFRSAAVPADDRVLPYEQDLVAQVRANSGPADIVLLEPEYELDARYLRLHRVIDRPTLVSWKFVPTNPADILRWYELLQERNALFAHGCSAGFQPRAALLVVYEKDALERIRDCGPVVWQSGGAALVRVGGP